jgi:diguanylate cyclase (GGDEF)-like protein
VRFGSRDGSGDAEPQLAFWRMHVHIGVALYGFGAVSVFLYALATPDHPHRAALEILDLAGLALSVTVLWRLGLRLVATRWRDTFFGAWSAWTILFIAVGAILDGGSRSPLAYLLVLPLLFAGLAYPPGTVGALAATALVAAVAVGASTPHGDPVSTGVMALAMGIAGLLTIAGASNRQRLNRDLVQLATHDGLTGVLTRRAFHHRLQEEIARAERYQRPFGVVMVDLDGMKVLNDTQGHRAGDGALVAMADALVGEVRGTDLVGRLGGDEFAVLLPETTAGEVEPALDRIRDACAAGAAGGTTASLGASVWNGSGDGAEDILRRADGALYAAKRGGRNRSVAWEPSLGTFSP